MKLIEKPTHPSLATIPMRPELAPLIPKTRRSGGTRLPFLTGVIAFAPLRSIEQQLAEIDRNTPPHIRAQEAKSEKHIEADKTKVPASARTERVVRTVACRRCGAEFVPKASRSAHCATCRPRSVPRAMKRTMTATEWANHCEAQRLKRRSRRVERMRRHSAPQDAA